MTVLPKPIPGGKYKLFLDNGRPVGPRLYKSNRKTIPPTETEFEDEKQAWKAAQLWNRYLKESEL